MQNLVHIITNSVLHCWPLWSTDRYIGHSTMIKHMKHEFAFTNIPLHACMHACYPELPVEELTEVSIFA